MGKRRRIQLLLEFTVDLLSIGIANLISFWLCAYFEKLPDHTSDNLILYAATLFISFTLILFGFTSSINLLKRSRLMETISVLRNCVLTYMVFAVLLVLTKNKLIEGRYLFLISLSFYFLLSLAADIF
jgi:hypothetical protein